MVTHREIALSQRRQLTDRLDCGHLVSSTLKFVLYSVTVFLQYRLWYGQSYNETYVNSDFVLCRNHLPQLDTFGCSTLVSFS